MQVPFKYDIMLRYHPAQGRWAKQLAERLDREGVKVWFDQWMIQNRRERRLELRRAIDESRHVALAISQDFVDDPWPSDQLYSGFAHAPASQNQRLLPLILDDCDLPKPVQGLKAIDFRGSDDDPTLFEFRTLQLLERLKPDFVAPNDLQRFRLRYRQLTIADDDEELRGFRAFWKSLQTLIMQVSRGADLPERREKLAVLQFVQRLFQWNTADLQFDRGEELFVRERYSEALKTFDRALTIDPNFAQAWARRGDTLVILRRYREAIDSYNGALAINPYDEPARLNLALLLGRLGQYKTAVINYDRLLELNPEVPEAWQNRAIRLAQLQRYKLALTSINQAIRYNDQVATAWVARGIILRALRKPKAAAVSYAEALKRDPRNARWWRYRGNAFLQANQIQAALKAYNRSLKLESKSVGSWHNRGLVLLQAGKNREAIANFDRAFKVNPDSYRTWHARGVAFQEMGFWDEALIHYEEALKIKSSHYPSQYAVAIAYCEVGKPQAALPWFERILEKQPRNFTVLFYQARTLRLLKQWPEAQAAAKTLQELNANDPLGWFAAAYIAADQGDWPTAIKHYTTVLELTPDDGVARNNRAWAYLQQGEWRQAQADITLALQEPQATFWHTQAEIARRQGDRVAAEHYCRCALALEPANPEAQLCLESLQTAPTPLGLPPAIPATVAPATA